MINVTRLAAILIAIVVGESTAQTPLANLHPHPKTAFPRAGSFVIAASTPIVVVDDSPNPSRRSAAWLRKQILATTGSSLSIVDEAQYAGASAIIVARFAESPSFDALLARCMPPGETLPTAGGYIVDVSNGRVLLMGADSEGVGNAIATFRQMVARDGACIAAHIWDYPDFPVRWVFNQMNLRGANAITTMRSILDTMSVLKLNTIQQNDFKYNVIESQPSWYFDSVRAYRAMSLERGIGIVPGVASIGYSEGILWHDPNLAEGIEARSRYVIEADTGRLIPDARVVLPNGNFESVGANGKFTGWSFYDDGAVTVDRTIFHSGGASARCKDFTAGNPSGNCRFNRVLACRPYSAYLMTAWMRTEDLTKGELRLLAIGTDGTNSRVLTYTAFALPATTSGWRQVQVVFNTLEYSQINVYAGLWSGETGTFWIDDFDIRENGLANVLRRTGTPLHVRSTNGGVEYREGADFAQIVDSRLGNGIYPWHQPPTFSRIPSGALRNGDTIDISYFHPVSTYADENGVGQTMVCVSEESLYTILGDQIRRVDTLYDAPQYFMNHDEIRLMNRDSACLVRNMSPAALLADNVTRCARIIDSVHPGADVFTWSDMFDSLHNATNDYYLINGDLRGVWGMIPKSVVITNWNNGEIRNSLDFFSNLGFRQVSAPYYDQRDTRNIREWCLAMHATEGSLGMMYTTWAADYSFLRPFAYYAWGAGPYIMHAPLDSAAVSQSQGDSIRIEAQIQADPYDRADRIESAQAIVDIGRSRQFVTLLLQTNDIYAGYARVGSNQEFRYSVTATNSQGLKRTTPTYVIAGSTSSAAIESATSIGLSLHVSPNPLRGIGSVSFVAVSASWRVDIYDALGRRVFVEHGIARPRELVTLALDTREWQIGAYRCVVNCGSSRDVAGIIVR